MEGLSNKARKQGIFGMTDVAQLLGVSTSTVKNLWNGRDGQPAQLVYHLTRQGKRYSTIADINAYRKKAYGKDVERLTLN